MNNLRFENHEAFYLLICVPILWLIARYLQKKSSAKMQLAFGARLYPFLSASLDKVKRGRRLLLMLTGLALYILTAARLQWGSKLQELKSQGVEIMVLFDVSLSMECEDVLPSRLEFAKKELNRFIDLTPGSRMGLVAFAGSAGLTSPITTDTGALKMFIDGLSPASVSRQGTDYAKAFGVAEEAFKRGGLGGAKNDDPQNKVTRVILVFSDGEDLEPGALEAATQLAKSGIRIFTVAFGTEKGGPIPVRDERGNLRGNLKDRSGQLVLTKSTGEVLKSLAEKGKGSFYFATIGSDYLKGLAGDIDKLDKTEFDSKLSMQYEEQYQWILAIAILVILLELYLGDRKSDFKFWRGRFEVPRS